MYIFVTCSLNFSLLSIVIPNNITDLLSQIFSLAALAQICSFLLP